jgi:hypothetical protein
MIGYKKICAAILAGTILLMCTITPIASAQKSASGIDVIAPVPIDKLPVYSDLVSIEKQMASMRDGLRGMLNDLKNYERLLTFKQGKVSEAEKAVILSTINKARSDMITADSMFSAGEKKLEVVSALSQNVLLSPVDRSSLSGKINQLKAQVAEMRKVMEEMKSVADSIMEKMK